MFQINLCISFFQQWKQMQVIQMIWYRDYKLSSIIFFCEKLDIMRKRRIVCNCLMNSNTCSVILHLPDEVLASSGNRHASKTSHSVIVPHNGMWRQLPISCSNTNYECLLNILQCLYMHNI